MGLNKDGTERDMKVWTLDDGSKVTTEDIMKALNCPRSTAYSRLARSTDPQHIYKEKQDTSGGKTYLLSDGSKWTVAQLAAHLDCLHSTAGVRLSLSLTGSNDVRKVLAPVNHQYSIEESIKRGEKKIREEQESRMIGDPLGHWKLINAHT
jgi:hypothetical protein